MRAEAGRWASPASFKLNLVETGAGLQGFNVLGKLLFSRFCGYGRICLQVGRRMPSPVTPPMPAVD